MQRGKEMEQFPTDLIAEIFSRLPSKSVARFCTLSKYWESTLRSREFAELFLTRSSTRPRLMFAVEEYGYNRWQFFSTPQQPQDQSKTTSLVEFHSKFKGDVSHYICSYASGLFCFPKVKIADESAHLVCNPITGLYVRLPYLEMYGESRAFLGFDPIDKQFKVIKRNYDHCILTLGTTGEDLSWRSNKTIGYEHCATDGICINGIVYWLVLNFGEGLSRVPLIVCCDVKTEEFSFINAKWFNVPFNDPYCLKMDPIVRLVNYKGKLGGIDWKKHGRSTVELRMWVLEDVEKQEWVNYVYTLPENEIFSSCGDFSIAGVTATGEIVLVMKFIRKPFYVFYFNPERNTLQSVEIQGFGADLETAKDPGEAHVFVDHVEDLSLNNANQLNLNISDIKSTCPCCEKEAKKEKEKKEEEEEVVESNGTSMQLVNSYRR